jgi:hypothetical protein
MILLTTRTPALLPLDKSAADQVEVEDPALLLGDVIIPRIVWSVGEDGNILPEAENRSLANFGSDESDPYIPLEHIYDQHHRKEPEQDIEKKRHVVKKHLGGASPAFLLMNQVQIPKHSI